MMQEETYQMSHDSLRKKLEAERLAALHDPRVSVDDFDEILARHSAMLAHDAGEDEGEDDFYDER